MESRIVLHWGGYQYPKEQKYCLQFFDQLYTTDWLNNDFAKFCIKSVDKSEHVKDYLILSPIFKSMGPERLSGGCKTLIMAYNNKDKVYPLRNLGDNCMDALYLSGVDGPTHWSYEGYQPHWRKDQLIEIASTNTVLTGEEATKWIILNRPDYDVLLPYLSRVL
ncbi:MAG: DUF4869 domain-containing protein [Lachnospiraceae bacterium]|nr:DUF4869 domain-containing protein [Lachnospiraceae bacterium]MCM1234120.1 DUF4869 domain-containing protein [Ruminococcus flavefaciens]